MEKRAWPWTKEELGRKRNLRRRDSYKKNLKKICQDGKLEQLRGEEIAEDGNK